MNAFEERIAALEGAERCVATASGMSAILACVTGLPSSADHIVVPRSIFGTTVQLLNAVLRHFGVDSTLVSLADVSEWEVAVRPNAKLLFVETPCNPLAEMGAPPPPWQRWPTA